MNDGHNNSPTSPKPLGLVMVTVFFAGVFALGLVLGPTVRGWVAHTDHAGEHAHGGGAADGESFYTCGMHPWVILPKPGLCPICQMDLTPVDPAKLTGQVTIDPVVVQNMGVRTQEVSHRPVLRTVQTVGIVTPNEELTRDFSIKTEGYVETLHVRSMGAVVKKGEPLFELYSPMLVTAQEEFAESIRSNADMGLREASRNRLRNLDVPEEWITRLEQGDAPRRTVSILSPWDGVVLDKMVLDGARVMPGMNLLRIADLTSVWIDVTIYEKDLPLVRVGQTAHVTLPGGGDVYRGEVSFVYPSVDMESRQAKVRILLNNSGQKLLPGMYVQVALDVGQGKEALSVAREAVIRSGKRNIVLLSLGAGRFEPREVSVGEETDDGRIVIMSGLKEKDLVVTSGQFLLDSEIRLREGLARMMRGTPPPDEPIIPAAEKPAVVDSGLTLSPEAIKTLETIIQTYLAMAETFTNDSDEGVADQAKKIVTLVTALRTDKTMASNGFWDKHPQAESLEKAAVELANADGLKAKRRAFTAVSDPLIELLQVTGVPKALGDGLVVHHCPMFRKDKGGASWVQAPGKVRNPYFGSGMLACADDTKALPKWFLAETTADPLPAEPPTPSEHNNHGNHQ